MTKTQLQEACVELCSVKGRPFSIVEDNGFRKIIEPIIKSLGNTFSINEHNVKLAVMEEATEI